jgi:oligosaccharide translocation protein RFT1
MNYRVPICQFFSFIFGYIWLHILTPPSTDITEHYTLGVWAICLSCVIEMCCEPVYLVAQAFLFVRLKVMTVQLLTVYSSIELGIRVCIQSTRIFIHFDHSEIK